MKKLIMEIKLLHYYEKIEKSWPTIEKKWQRL